MQIISFDCKQELMHITNSTWYCHLICFLETAWSHRNTGAWKCIYTKTWWGLTPLNYVIHSTSTCPLDFQTCEYYWKWRSYRNFRVSEVFHKVQNAWCTALKTVWNFFSVLTEVHNHSFLIYHLTYLNSGHFTETKNLFNCYLAHLFMFFFFWIMSLLFCL